MFDLNRQKEINYHIKEMNALISNNKIEDSANHLRKVLEISMKLLAMTYLTRYKNKRYADVKPSETKMCFTSLYDAGIINEGDQDLLFYINKAGNSGSHARGKGNRINLGERREQEIYKIKVNHFIDFLKEYLDKVPDSLIDESNGNTKKHQQHAYTPKPQQPAYTPNPSYQQPAYTPNPSYQQPTPSIQDMVNSVLSSCGLNPNNGTQGMSTVNTSIDISGNKSNSSNNRIPNMSAANKFMNKFGKSSNSNSSNNSFDKVVDVHLNGTSVSNEPIRDIRTKITKLTPYELAKKQPRTRTSNVVQQFIDEYNRYSYYVTANTYLTFNETFTKTMNFCILKLQLSTMLFTIIDDFNRIIDVRILNYSVLNCDCASFVANNHLKYSDACVLSAVKNTALDYTGQPYFYKLYYRGMEAGTISLFD